LHGFATALLERRGALVEWSADDEAGVAILPSEVAAEVGAAEEVVPLAYEAAGKGLSVSLAGDFLDWAGRLLEAEPRVGAFRTGELYLKRKDLDEAVRRAFTWLNAKVTVRGASEMAIEYHTWWFYASIHSEDRWESRFAVALNAESGVEVEIPDPLGLLEIQPRAAGPSAVPSSYDRAAVVARRRVLGLAADFFQRMDARLARDRKRIRDYYGALLRETDLKKARAHAPPDPEKTAARKRAVDLELRRKLAELDERYAMQATLAPVVVLRTQVTVMAVELSVFRKQAHAMRRAFWNPLLKQLEPIACSRCGEGTLAVAFTNDDVQPLCTSCTARPEQ
jgi:hypothetical protein